MSLRLLVVAALMLVCSVCVTEAIPDFDDKEGDYQFIYHDDKNLLLMVSNRSCIYIGVQDSGEEVRYLTTYQQTTEEYLLGVIKDHPDRLGSSDLQSVRDTFNDILADFHCLEKTIYTLTLDFNDIHVVHNNHCDRCVSANCPDWGVIRCHSICPDQCSNVHSGLFIG